MCLCSSNLSPTTQLYTYWQKLIICTWVVIMIKCKGQYKVKNPVHVYVTSESYDMENMDVKLKCPNRESSPEVWYVRSGEGIKLKTSSCHDDSSKNPRKALTRVNFVLQVQWPHGLVYTPVTQVRCFHSIFTLKKYEKHLWCWTHF